ncbi:hypothetical protein INR49_030318 [Caranx melampygus]|nr:hypothetical protein INR49_030318 [Caranx melampygus]
MGNSAPLWHYYLLFSIQACPSNTQALLSLHFLKEDTISQSALLKFGDVLVVGLVLELSAEVLDGFVQAFLQRHLSTQALQYGGVIVQ